MSLMRPRPSRPPTVGSAPTSRRLALASPRGTPTLRSRRSCSSARKPRKPLQQCPGQAVPGRPDPGRRYAWRRDIIRPCPATCPGRNGEGGITGNLLDPFLVAACRASPWHGILPPGCPPTATSPPNTTRSWAGSPPHPCPTAASTTASSRTPSTSAQTPEASGSGGGCWKPSSPPPKQPESGPSSPASSPRTPPAWHSTTPPGSATLAPASASANITDAGATLSSSNDAAPRSKTRLSFARDARPLRSCFSGSVGPRHRTACRSQSVDPWLKQMGRTGTGPPGGTNRRHPSHPRLGGHRSGGVLACS